MWEAGYGIQAHLEVVERMVEAETVKRAAKVRRALRVVREKLNGGDAVHGRMGKGERNWVKRMRTKARNTMWKRKKRQMTNWISSKTTTPARKTRQRKTAEPSTQCSIAPLLFCTSHISIACSVSSNLSSSSH